MELDDVVKYIGDRVGIDFVFQWSTDDTRFYISDRNINIAIDVNDLEIMCILTSSKQYNCIGSVSLREEGSIETVCRALTNTYRSK